MGEAPEPEVLVGFLRDHFTTGEVERMIRLHPALRVVQDEVRWGEGHATVCFEVVDACAHRQLLPPLVAAAAAARPLVTFPIADGEGTRDAERPPRPPPIDGAATGWPTRGGEVEALRAIPMGPMVPRERIPPFLAEEVADLYPGGEDCRARIDQARAWLRAAWPETTRMLQQAELPEPSAAGTLVFWRRVLVGACPYGPRMVGAVLLAVGTEGLTDATRTGAMNLFADLQTGRYRQ